MAKRPTVSTIASGYYSTTVLNNNFTNIRDQFDNTLSLDGSTPNQMQADLDMNNNDILNANVGNFTTVKIGGVPVSASAVTVAASDVTVVDAGGYYTGTEVETALQEVGLTIDGLGTISTQDANNVTITGGSITGITDLTIADGGTGASTATGALENLGLLETEDAGSYNTGLLIPVGTTAQRPATPDGQQIRYNTTDGSFEGYNGSSWGSLGGAGFFQGENGDIGTTAALGDIFRTHESELNTDVTIASGRNSLCAGPLTVASGTTLTVNGNLVIA